MFIGLTGHKATFQDAIRVRERVCCVAERGTPTLGLEDFPKTQPSCAVYCAK